MSDISYDKLVSVMGKAYAYLLEIREPKHWGVYPDNCAESLDRNLADVLGTIEPYIYLQPINDAPEDTIIRIFGGTLIDPHWETSGSENTYGVIGYYNKETNIAKVQHSSYEVQKPTHFMLAPNFSDGLFEVLKKHV